MWRGQIFEVTKRLKGSEHADVAFLLRAQEMSALAATVNDPEYLACVAKRNETFKRAAIARALTNDPGIIVADEPPQRRLAWEI